MAAKAPQPFSQPLYAWGGCFVGGNVGAGWHRIEQSQIASTDGTVFTPPIDWGASQHADFIGGGQVGCNYQFSENWVLGAQEMFDFGDIKSSNNLPDPRLAAAAPFQNTTTHEIITATARLGYLFTPQLLGYVKGGGAWTRTSTAVFFSIPAVALSESADADRSGSHNVTFTAAPGALGAPSIVSTRLTLQTAEVGVNWRFTSLLGAAPH
jgi:outer membrane immunogenic protein